MMSRKWVALKKMSTLKKEEKNEARTNPGNPNTRCNKIIISNYITGVTIAK